MSVKIDKKTQTNHWSNVMHYLIQNWSNKMNNSTTKKYFFSLKKKILL